MIKFVPEDKMKVERHCEILGANQKIVRMWIKEFEYHGIQAFEKSYIKYSVQYKLDLLNYMFENGTSPKETAVIFNISSSGFIR
ncbi:hypothetical protein [Bacillus cereus]|uniref:hypothetical protein n=1 Tax=Bacillus cereus TaxID=1396 RepID=UPI001153E5B5|nr:hypothetical protein [Bacillus cereus]